MSEERLQIMRMVEQGKLSAEEAVKLLEAVEAPSGPADGPKPRRVRVQVAEDGRSTQITVSAGLVCWVLSLRPNGLRAALENGAPGKVFEAAEGSRKVEVWLEA